MLRFFIWSARYSEARIDSALGLRRMARLSKHFHLEMQASVVGGGDGVGEAGRDREIGRRDALGEQPRGTDFSARFLVVREMQLDRPVEFDALLCRRAQRAKRERICREVGLRDGDPATVHDTVTHFGSIRIMRPVLAGRDDVTMRAEGNRRAAAGSEAHAHDEVRARAHAVRNHVFLRHDVTLDVEAHRLEQRSGLRRVRRTVARRIVGRHSNECGEETLRFVAVLGQPAADGLPGVRTVRVPAGMRVARAGRGSHVVVV